MRPLTSLIFASSVFGVMGAVAPSEAELMTEAMLTGRCMKPGTWPAIERCLRNRAPATTVRAATPRTRIVTLHEHQRFLFVQLADGLWRNVLQFTDPEFTVVDERAIVVAKQPGLRVELRHRIPMTINGASATLGEKIALVCADGECHRMVYACIVMARGKAIETFLGAVTITADGSISVTGDRAQSGPHCTNR